MRMNTKKEGWKIVQEHPLFHTLCSDQVNAIVLGELP